MASDGDPALGEFPETGKLGGVARSIINAASGAVPLVGGLLAAAAGAWSEHDQERVNRFFHAWIKMMQAQFKEQERTMIEIMMRLDVHDEKIADRVESAEFQSLVRKAFRDWAGAESEQKRTYVRNILANAASSSITSDDVIRMFLDWLARYSDLHFVVIAAIYNNAGITRGEIWRRIGKGLTREDSADADLYKLLIRDLSTGGIIRQHRETDYHGNFVRKQAPRRPANAGPAPPVSAFDQTEGYELTQLGQQFVHYAMTDLPPKIEFNSPSEAEDPTV